MSELRKKLKNIHSLPMHMPGHKRNSDKFPELGDFFSMDITEIDGFDNLHGSNGILKDSMEKASAIFGSEVSFYLVNGSTCGILAGICAMVSEGDVVICDRIAHKSVYNAIELSGAKAVFMQPKIHSHYGITLGFTPQALKDALMKNPNTRLVVITCPSYEGAVCDIAGICRVAHSYGVPVLVDAAHGAHFGFYKFPKSAVSCGADIVVQSLHKTLPSLTQTAILHTKEKYSAKIADKLSVFETSSPSYILMASIDYCVNLLSDEKLFSDWYDMVSEFLQETKKLENLKILEQDKEIFDYDISKITILAKDAKRLAIRLRELGIEPEMTSSYYVLCMTGPGDSRETLATLKDALFLLDKDFSPFEKISMYPSVPSALLTVKEALKLPCEYVSPSNAVGRICAEYLRAYPPGVPIVIPGELFSQETIATLSSYIENNIALLGDSSHISGEICVVKE